MRGLWYRNYHVAACRQHNSKHTQLCSAEMSSWGKKMHYRCDVWPLLTRISDGHVFWTRSLVKLCSAAFGVQCKSLTRIMEITRWRLIWLDSGVTKTYACLSSCLSEFKPYFCLICKILRTKQNIQWLGRQALESRIVRRELQICE